jgi:hypothetical protein
VGEAVLLAFQIGTSDEAQFEEVWGHVKRVRMDDDVWIVGLEFHEVLDRQRTPLLADAATRPMTEP